MTQRTWALVMTVLEPRALLLSNLAWHLGTGAHEILVYFDDPSDPVIAEAAALPGVTAIICDADHWRHVAPKGSKPDTIRRRQALNANHAQTLCTADWLFHIDADEFLLQERPLSDELAYVSELDCEMFFPVAERVFIRGAQQESFFSGVFRRSTKARNRRRDGFDNDKVIYSDHHPLLLHGVLGHSAGKCGVPVREGYEIGIHWAYRGKKRERAARYASSSTTLLHFDGLTPLHWLSKMLRYAGYDASVLSIAEHRRAQIEILLDVAHDADAILEFHQEMKEFDTQMLARLRGFGLLLETAFEPETVIKKVLGFVPDLRPEPFDEELFQRYPERLAVLRPKK